MEQREPLVDLLLRVLAVLREDALQQEPEHDVALLRLGRDRRQPAVDEVGAQGLRLVGRGREPGEGRVQRLAVVRPGAAGDRAGSPRPPAPAPRALVPARRRGPAAPRTPRSPTAPTAARPARPPPARPGAAAPWAAAGAARRRATPPCPASPRASPRCAAGAGRRARAGRRGDPRPSGPSLGSATGYAWPDASQRSAARGPPAAGRRHGQGRRSRGGDRAVGPPGVHGQPGLVAPPRRAAHASCRPSATASRPRASIRS